MQRVALENVSLTYRRGAAPALSDVSLVLTPGITGLVGVNGAGKSSLLRLLLGTRRPTSGRITIEGIATIGFIPERPMFPAYLSVAEFLDGLREMMGAGPPTAPESALHESFAIGALSSVRLGQLSLGQKRRVEVMAALIGDPSLLLLDEPTNGLDPLAVTALRAGVLGCRRDDRVIVVSSHHLDELQRIADRVIMIDQGRIVGMWDGNELGALESRFLSLAGRNA